MKRILIAGFVFSTLSTFAQKATKPDAYAKTITADDLKKHLYIVAGPEMEGRETATPGQKRAAAYIESQFRSLGLQPGNNGSYQLFYDVFQDSLTNATLEVNGQPFQLDKDFNPNLGNYPATLKFSEITFIGSGASDSVKNMNLTGKLVMVIATAPQGRGGGGGSNILPQLANKGIAGVLMIGGPYPRPIPLL